MQVLHQTSAIAMEVCVFVLEAVVLHPFWVVVRESSDLIGLRPCRTAASCRRAQGLMAMTRPELQNSAQPKASANAQQTRTIGTRTNATTIIAVFCLGFMAIPLYS
ncbi:hypothetical protein BDV19DRAFT_326347 [Aspergillus venezuelensis]